MAYPARDINFVYVNKPSGAIMVSVGDDIRMDIERLPRQDLRRVCAFLGLGGRATKTNEQLLDDVRSWVSSDENVGAMGIVFSRTDSRGWLDLTKMIEETTLRVLSEKGLA